MEYGHARPEGVVDVHRFRSSIRRPSPALILALFALVLSLSGTAAAARIVTSNSEIARNTISGHTPPANDHPNIIAGTISDEDLAPLARWHAVGAPGQPDFGLCDGCNPQEQWGNRSGQTGDASLTAVRFYEYHGVVSLEGVACPFYRGLDNGGFCTASDVVSADSTIFQLPAGYRPKHTEYFAVPTGQNGDAVATVLVNPAGKVIARNFAQSGVWLDGISIRLDN